ncbi:hypothetical protein, partial [Acinetobacter indicus]|uniref:hypothetical protein n=1 Tax=Acinetobacter indicus TaxID=756892 RepID=UPI001C089F8D
MMNLCLEERRPENPKARQGLGYRVAEPMHFPIKRAPTRYIEACEENESSSRRVSVFDRLGTPNTRRSVFERLGPQRENEVMQQRLHQVAQKHMKNLPRKNMQG